MNPLHKRTEQWAIAREIITPDGHPHKATLQGQLDKTIEELNELADALALPSCEDNRRAAMMECGDVQVCLILLARMLGTHIESCPNSEVTEWDQYSAWALLAIHTIDEGMGYKQCLGTLWSCAESAAEMLGTTADECLEMALDKIEKRKGSINTKTGQWDKVTA
jgi:hypothetical protein